MDSEKILTNSPPKLFCPFSNLYYHMIKTLCNVLSLSIVIDEKDVEKSTNDVETVSSTSAEAGSSKKATTASAATETTDKSTTFEPFQSNDHLRMVRFEDHFNGKVIAFMGGDTILKFIAEKYDESSKLYPKHIAERCLIDEKLWFASNKLLKRMEDYFVSEVNVKLKKQIGLPYPFLLHLA